MSKISSRKLNDELRVKFLEQIIDFLSGTGEEVLRVGTGEISIPCVNSAGDDTYVNLIVKVPSGARGEDYDGYEAAEDFKFLQEEKAKKKAEKERKKKEKIEKDKREREQRKKQKELEQLKRMK